MKESYNEGVASHIGPVVMPRRPARVWGSVDRGKHRRAIELRKHHIPEAELVVWREGKTGHRDKRVMPCSGGVRELGMCGHSSRENRETSGRNLRGTEAATSEATGKVSSHTPVVVSPEESDGNIVPGKLANNGMVIPAESMEERTPAKRNSGQEAASRIQSWNVCVEWTGTGASESLLWRHLLEAGAVCGSFASTDLCGGYWETSIPTATRHSRAPIKTGKK